MAKLNEKTISEFVDTMMPAKEEVNHEFTANGTVASVDSNGVALVYLDGGDSNGTPCQTTVGCSAGDRVIVSFKNREPVVTSNITSPSTSVAQLNAEVANINTVMAQKATISYVDTKTVNAVDVFAENGTFKGTLRAQNGVFGGAIICTHKNMYNVHICDPNWSPVLYIDSPNIAGLNSWFTGSTLGFAQNSAEATMDYQGVHTSSDARLKEDVIAVDPELAKQIMPVQFRYKGDVLTRYGFLAQNVQNVLPDAVSENDNGYLTLNYQELIAPLYALVQELQKEVDELRKEVKALET